MPVWRFSQTSNANGSADPTQNWLEGQSPSSLNDSARALLAALAQYRDDISGAIVTGGTSTNFTLSTFSQFDTLAHLANQVLAFTPHATSTNGVGVDATLNVDSNGPKPVRIQPGIPLPSGTLVLGSPYVCVYNNTDGVFYLHNMVNPYSVPLLGGFDYWDTISPSSAYVFPAGQAISRVTYSATFARWGTRFGAGDGSATFNVPNKAGKVSAMIEASPSLLTSTYFGGNSTLLGAIGGGESHTLTTTEIPSHTHANTLTDPSHSHQEELPTPGGGATWNSVSGSSTSATFAGPNTGSVTTGITINNAAQGGGAAHAIVQPTITCNYVIRVL